MARLMLIKATVAIQRRKMAKIIKGVCRSSVRLAWGMIKTFGYEGEDQ